VLQRWQDGERWPFALLYAEAEGLEDGALATIERGVVVSVEGHAPKGAHWAAIAKKLLAAVTPEMWR
jgi:hypothetical protein